ncbi:MAG: beta-ketoacyl-ACP reductase [Planctomycetaceae bacterium]|nr:beta-ketoacyl-ACP reductase [Planctomycetaceae bacterium]
MDFTDKVVVVTGASRGIGQSTAVRFLRANAHVVANIPSIDSGTHRELVEGWVKAEQLDSSRVTIKVANVDRPQEVNAMFDELQAEFSQIDVLVNNAGINRDHTIGKMTDDEWNAVIDVNLSGTFFCSRAAAKLLRDGGSIVNISSMVAHTGNFGVANYAASKAGVLGLSKTLALELAGRGITVNAVCPGFINTAMVESMPDHVIDRIVEQIPLGRRGETDDIAQTIVFLASESARYITGQSIGVNGGLHMH